MTNRLPVGRPEFYAGTVMTEVDGPNVRIVYGAQMISARSARTTQLKSHCIWPPLIAQRSASGGGIGSFPRDELSSNQHGCLQSQLRHLVIESRR
ncbi:hypothetical protein [Bradyrhizobium sp. 33ap4]|uniref:hypothetical protein n=1 Tax=Bradyrhizobium sp. 33ap4 TaxID=3061630 RepID=UPI00292D933F|nr:hypothetical protein [Bradyrhizobium sp. 33ap4]